MPIFVDRHLAEVVRDDAWARAVQEAEAGVVAYGVRILGHWVGEGYVYCVLDAPDADAVYQHHTSCGLPCDDLRPIEGVKGASPVSAEDEQVVRASIARNWPAERA